MMSENDMVLIPCKTRIPPSVKLPKHKHKHVYEVVKNTEERDDG